MVWTTWLLSLGALVLVLNAKSLPFAFHVRLIMAVVAGLRGGKFRRISGEDVWRTTVSIDDMDWNGHMNNSSYNRLADCARYQYIARLLGSLSQLKRLHIANGGVAFQFIKEVRLFNSIAFHTQAIAHDRKWLLLRHEVRRGKTLCAVGLSKMVFKAKTGKTIPPRQVLEGLGYDVALVKATGDDSASTTTGAGAAAVLPPSAMTTPTAIPMAQRAASLQSPAVDLWLQLELCLQKKLD